MYYNLKFFFNNKSTDIGLTALNFQDNYFVVHCLLLIYKGGAHKEEKL